MSEDAQRPVTNPYVYITSVRTAIKTLVRLEGLDALGSVEAVRRALQWLADTQSPSKRPGFPEATVPEATVLRAHVSESLLVNYVTAARNGSGDQLTNAAVHARGVLRKNGVSRRDASIAASEIALGVSDALDMKWHPDPHRGLTDKTATSIIEASHLRRIVPVAVCLTVYLVTQIISSGYDAMKAGGKAETWLAETIGMVVVTVLCLALFYYGSDWLRRWQKKSKRSREECILGVVVLATVVLCVMLLILNAMRPLP